MLRMSTSGSTSWVVREVWHSVNNRTMKELA